MTTTKGGHTQKSLEMALRRITSGRVRRIKTDRKLSIAAVADEAGVSASTVHNRYPEIADKVRQLLNKEARQHRENKNQELKEEKAKRKQLIDENRALRNKITELASRNATLEVELDQLRGVVHGNNISVIKPKVSE